MGRHGGPGSDGDPSPEEGPASGRRRAPDPAATPGLEPRPDDDELTTLGRRTRAERRQEGLLPPGEDPLSGRAVRSARPTPPPPPPARPTAREARPPARPDGSAPPRPVTGGDRVGAPPPVSGPRTSSDPLTSTRPPVSRTPRLQPPAGPTTAQPATSDLPLPAGPPTPPERRPPGASATGETPTTTQVPRDRVPAVPLAAPRRDPGPAAVDPGPATVETPAPADRGPATGPQGRRAAVRAERQAADAARRKEDRRRGVTAAPAPVVEEPRRGSRGVVLALVAVVVVALVLLSVWSFTQPGTEPAAQSQPQPSVSSTQAPPAAPTSTAPAPSDTPAAPPPAGPVFAPVSVLNSAGISGLAAGIGDALLDGGWEIRTLGTYGSDDVATTTVFFTEGDVAQEQAAQTLVEQFPEVSGPAVRFFEIPDLPDPGIVVIATGSWQP